MTPEKNPNKSEKPNMPSFLAESASEELHLLLRGHLHLEALIDDLLARSLTDPGVLADRALSRLSFPARVKLLEGMGRMDAKTGALLLGINRLRNKVAHELRFAVAFGDAFELARLAAEAGVDFSDETIHRDKKLSEEWYGARGILLEVISNAFQDLVWRNEDLLGEEGIDGYLG